MADNTDLSGMRKPYKGDVDALTEDSLAVKSPFTLFEDWFSLASNTGGIKEANAMALATADKSGRPSVRYVLLKGFGKNGFCFFTNHNSRKGKELAENPVAALVFYWDQLSFQIRIEGKVERLDENESEYYFHSRPRSSQISALASQQSSVIESRAFELAKLNGSPFSQQWQELYVFSVFNFAILNKKREELEKEFCDPLKVIPKPDCWGGYKLIPEVFEFWQGQTSRLHDRIRFRRPNPGEEIDNNKSFICENGWVRERLCP